MSFNLNDLKYYAIKIYNREDYDDSLLEIEIFKKLSSVNNLVLYVDTFIYVDDDIDDNEGNNMFMCCVMELLGYSMYDIIKLFRHTHFKIPPKYILSIVKQTTNILTDINKLNYIHTDIKPENILIVKDKFEYIPIFNFIKDLIKNKKQKDIKPSLFINSNLKNLLDKLDDIDYTTYTNHEFKVLFNYIFNNELKIKICDLGTIMNPNDKTLYKKHTIYYRAPEIILNLPYDFKYDIWSLGCSIYEMMTYKILFDPEDENTDRHHMYLLYSYFGIIPEDMILNSRIKYLFFTKDLTRLRTYKKIEHISITQPLTQYINDLDIDNDINNVNDIETLINVLFLMLKIDPNERITSNDLNILINN